MSFSSWDIIFFVTPVFRESEAVSVSQISETFELKAKWGQGANQKWSKHGFHGYIDWYGLERHGAAILVKLKRKLCRKENFDSKWRMTVYGWPKVKLFYYISIK